jgi:ParB-like chromosome segregation protein Spo0J
MSDYAKFFAQQAGAGQITAIARQELVAVPSDRIRRGLIQYRLHFDPDRIEALASLFVKKGFIGALLLHPDPDDDGYYRLIGGERSWRAGQSIGMKTFDAFIVNSLSMTAIAELGFTHNSASEPLSVYENTLGILDILQRNLEIAPEEVIKLLHRMVSDLRNWRKAHPAQKGLPLVAEFTQQPGADTVEAVFSRLSTSTQWPGFVNNWLPLLKVPAPLQEAMVKGDLEPSKAILLARASTDPEVVGDLTTTAVAQGLSLAGVRELVDRAPRPGRTPPSEPQQAKGGSTSVENGPRNSVLQKRAASICKTAKMIGRLSAERQAKVLKLFDEIEALMMKKRDPFI